MVLPTVERNWQFNVNNEVTCSSANGSNLAVTKNTIITAKNILVGSYGAWTDRAGAEIAPNNLWSVDSSCDGTLTGFGVSGDGIDRWTTFAGESTTGSIIQNDYPFGAPHSWMILKNTSLTSNFQWLWDANVTDEMGYFSPAIINQYISRLQGFAGGNFADNPSAADQQLARQSAFLVSDSNSSYFINVMISDDGLATRLFIVRQNELVFFWSIEKIINPVTGWEGIVATNEQGYNPSSVSTVCRALHLDGYFNVKMTGDFVTQIAAGATDSFTGEYLINNINLFGFETKVGYMGKMSDIWWCSANSSNTLPATGERNFLQLSKFLIPWNGSIPQLA
jgi:hypothetical protein